MFNHLAWRLDRVRQYLARLPLDHVRGIVFGSVARQACSIGSDTDLLVISDDLPAAIRDRIDVLGELTRGLALMAAGFTAPAIRDKSSVTRLLAW